jgi:cation diffusion facilitator CzcD-associated flavoprotein CzcO
MPSSYKSYDELTYPVIIIGAGFGGIIMACQLQRKLRLKPHQFLILERHSQAGGTWWINKYPGVACDIPTAWYSISFEQKSDWSTFYPEGPEIFEYANSVIDKYGFRSSISLNTEVVRAVWCEDAQEWAVTMRHLKPGAGDLSGAEKQARVESKGQDAVYGTERTVRCKVLVSAVGGFVEPSPFPANVPGKDTFKGQIVHSARWDENIDLRDKDVVVVGTGCSATQLVPRLLGDEYGAKSVTQLMREPHWVLLKALPPGGTEFWRRWGKFLFTYVPGYRLAIRALIIALAELDWAKFSATGDGAAARARVETQAIEHLKKATPEKVT